MEPDRIHLRVRFLRTTIAEPVKIKTKPENNLAIEPCRVKIISMAAEFTLAELAERLGILPQTIRICIEQGLRCGPNAAELCACSECVHSCHSGAVSLRDRGGDAGGGVSDVGGPTVASFLWYDSERSFGRNSHG
jgi:hypothetical protein